MEHTIDFFRDEVRNGFYIPTAIKQAWAATLDVLAEIDRVCEKHDIKYFADWGTFLGAVRHGGFVPWDDDLDICMLRDDYIKFRAVADKELAEGYVIHDYERHQDHWLFLSRVVNNSKMCFDEAYLNAHNNFPWLAGVDIFVKDYLYADDEKESRRDKEVMNIIAVADGIVKGALSTQAASVHINEIRKKYHVRLPVKYSEHDMAVALYKLAEQQMARVKPEETDRVGQIFPWVLKRGPKAGEKKELYQSIIRLPFEDTTIPVPTAYNTVLTSRYGNYLRMRKVWDGHDYPFFEGQMEEIEQLSGEKFPGFTFNRSMLKRHEPDTSGSLKTTAQECLTELTVLLADAENILRVGTLEEFTQAAADIQQLAVDFGTLIEQVKGEERACTKRVIEALQGYCDAIWEEYQEIEGGASKDELPISRMALEKVSESVKANILDRREILFLPIGPKEWKALEPVYERMKDDEADIFVVPLPLMKKTFFGTVSMTDEEIESAVHLDEYLPGITYTDWAAYDPRLHCPDEIYVQNPYDGANPCLTEPPDFYVRNLQRYTDRIVYIPISETGEFGPEDVTDQYNLKHYVAAPGVVYADKVIVQSENIKKQYVNALTAFAGEETRAIWQGKISIDNHSESALRNGKKKVLYCIGANELTEHKDSLAECVKEKLQTFIDAGNKLCVTVSLYPDDRMQWRQVNETLSNEVFGTIDKAFSGKEYEEITVTVSEADMVASSYDAYYGSPSPFVPAFVVQGKPVMLANYGIKKVNLQTSKI